MWLKEGTACGPIKSLGGPNGCACDIRTNPNDNADFGCVITKAAPAGQKCRCESEVSNAGLVKF